MLENRTEKVKSPETEDKDVAFFVSATNDVSKALSRYSALVKPATLSREDFKSEETTKDTLIKILPEVEIEDPYFRTLKPDFLDDENLSEIGILTAAKIEAISKESSPEIKTVLEEAKYRVLASIGKAVSRVGKKRALQTMLGGSLALMTAACGVQGNTQRSPEISSTAPRQTETSTFIPTPIQTDAVSPTPEPTKTVEPTSTKEAVSESDLEELSGELSCDPWPTCIHEMARPTAKEKDMMSIEAISTGVFEEREVRDASGNVVGQVILLNMVTRDAQNQPEVIQVVVQGNFSNYPDHPYTGVLQVLLLRQGTPLNEVKDKATLLDVNEWVNYLPRGTTMTINFDKNGQVLTQLENDVPFESDQYQTEINVFAETKGNTDSILIIVPAAISF